jgi:hypothetical protein
LAGAEATVFVEALGMMVDMLRDGEFEFGQPIIDRLQQGQRLVVFEQVATGLLRTETPEPRLTAVVEAAVAAVYEWITDMVRMEIELAGDTAFEPKHPTWRQLVWNASHEAKFDELPPADSSDVEKWESLVDLLSERVLWDRDFEYEARYVDADPALNARVKDVMGIDDDYFVAVPDEPPESELGQILERLNELTSSARQSDF